MHIECTADVTISDDGKYINAVSVSPSAGIRFNFKPRDGGKMTAGHYFIKGVMSESSGVSTKGESGPRAYRVANVLGEAVRGKSEFVPEKAGK